jgi:hypothetical protein
MRNLTALWCSALADLIVRHPNRTSKVLLEITDEPVPHLHISLDKTLDSTSNDREMRSPFRIASVKLTFWPGVKLARMWFAAGFAGYCLHEALEMVTVGDLETRPLDPHEAPFTYDRGLRDGLPAALTPETMIESLAVVMSHKAASTLVAGRPYV